MARPATIHSDGIWAALSIPRAVRHVGSEDQTYLGHTNTSGDAMVTAFDETGVAVSSFTLNAALDVDSHLTPAFRVRSDGKIQAFYSAHNAALRERLSTSAEDISAWDAESTVLSGSYTYPQVWDLTGKVVLHARSGSSTNGHLIFTESTDDGGSWSAEKVLYYAGAVGVYFRTAKHPTDDRIDYMVTDGNPNNDATNVYHFYREGDSFYKSDGTLIGTTGDLDGTTGSAFGPADLTKVWDEAVEGADGHPWDIAHDGSGNPVMIIAAVGASDSEMHHAVWNGSSWDLNKIADVGGGLVTGEPASSGGAALDPEDASRVWLSIEDGGLTQIWRYDTADGGSTWSGTQITHDYRLNARPVVPLNRSARMRVAWWRGRHDSYLDYDTALVGYGDDSSTGGGTLSRTTDGEVFTAFANSQDDPFAIGDWEAQASVDTLAVQAGNGALAHKGVSTGSWHYVRCSAGASRSTRMVQAVQAMAGGSGQVWIRQGGHMETGGAGDQMAGIQYSVDRSPDRTGLFEAQGTSFLGGTTTDASAKGQDVPYRASVGLDGFSLVGHDFHDGSSKSHTGTNFSSGWSGIGGNDLDDLELYEFFDCTHWELTATGLSTGDKLQLRNALGVVLKEAIESGGTATIDMTDVVIPEVNDLVVVDSGGALIGGLTLAGAGGPMEYARGGDAYSFTATAAPDQPTITATVEGAHSIGVESSPYSHPDSVGIAKAEWQIATDSGFTTDLQTFTESFPSPGEALDPPAHSWAGLDAGTLYYVRVRHQDVNGLWSPWSASDSATTDAATPLNTPSVTADPSFDQVELTGSALSDPEDPDRTLVMAEWQVDEAGGDYSTPVAESLEDAENLLSIILTGLTASTNYIARYRQRVDDGTWSAWSSDEPFTTDAVVDPPDTPTASLEEKGARSITLGGTAFSYPTEPLETHAATLAQVSTSSSFDSGVFQTLFEPGAITELLVSGLTPDTTYYCRIRYQASNGEWSAWSAAILVTTDGSVLDPGTFLRPTHPRHGEVVRGAAFEVSWAPESEAGVTFEVQIAEAGGDEVTLSWSAVVVDHASSPYTWDTTVFNDGPHLLRLRASDATYGTPWEYRMVYIDNGENPLLYNANFDDGQPAVDFTPIWNTDGHTWDLDGNKVVNEGSNLSSTGEAALAWAKPAQPTDVDVTVEVLNASTGGAFPWSWFPEQCWGGAAVFASSDVGVTSGLGKGIFATFYALPIQAHGDCFHAGRGDGFLSIGVFDGSATPVELETVAIGKIHFTKLWDDCDKVPRYGVRVRVTTVTDNGDGTRRIRLQAAVMGMEIDSNAENLWQYDKELEVNNICGEVGYASREITTSRAYRSFTNITALASDYGSCEASAELDEVNAVADLVERAWAFVLDGHIFYVLNFKDRPALVCDLTTGQWHSWYTREFDPSDIRDSIGVWNMFRGIMWNGRVIAADISDPFVWELEPHSMFDEATYAIRRAVTAFQPLRGSASARQGSMRLTARKESLAKSSTIRMRFSDDGGNTWSQWFTVVLEADSYSRRVEWRSLGRLRAPGRIWEIEDAGGLVRIEGTDADLEGG